MTGRPNNPTPSDPRIPKGYLWLIENIGHQGQECLLWPFAFCTPGYGIFMHQKTNHRAHRYMCEAVHGPAPESYQAAHSCGNRRCVNLQHLSWKSAAENQADRHLHGTNNKGRSKLTLAQARQIRSLKGVETSIVTTAKYGVTESNVRSIQSGNSWNEQRTVYSD